MTDAAGSVIYFSAFWMRLTTLVMHGMTHSCGGGVAWKELRLSVLRCLWFNENKYKNIISLKQLVCEYTFYVLVGSHRIYSLKSIQFTIRRLYGVRQFVVHIRFGDLRFNIKVPRACTVHNNYSIAIFYTHRKGFPVYRTLGVLEISDNGKS